MSEMSFQVVSVTVTSSFTITSSSVHQGHRVQFPQLYKFKSCVNTSSGELRRVHSNKLVFGFSLGVSSVTFEIVALEMVALFKYDGISVISKYQLPFPSSQVMNVVIVAPSTTSTL